MPKSFFCGILILIIFLVHKAAELGDHFCWFGVPLAIFEFCDKNKLVRLERKTTKQKVNFKCVNFSWAKRTTLVYNWRVLPSKTISKWPSVIFYTRNIGQWNQYQSFAEKTSLGISEFSVNISMLLTCYYTERNFLLFLSKIVGLSTTVAIRVS